MEKPMIVAIGIIAVLAGGLIYVLAGGVQSPTGAFQGYNSYDEMMAAHHGPQESGEQTGLGGCGGETGSSGQAQPTGAVSSYGISYDEVGYNKLLSFSAAPITPEQKQAITGLDFLLPCCGYQSFEPDANCGCGHHIAMQGLANLLVANGWDSDSIQQELNVWKEMFYPGSSTGGMGGC